jgi:hypothetical protein
VHREDPGLEKEEHCKEINCAPAYGVSAMIATSWHCSMEWNNNSGALLGKKSAENNMLLFHRIIAVGLPYDASSCTIIV